MSRNPAAKRSKPASIDAAIALVRDEFPDAKIRITDRNRTVKDQAKLMAERIIKNRGEFLSTYRPSRHIAEMDKWFGDNPKASLDATIAAFATIIKAARERGAVVSNHLDDSARDIGWPKGTTSQLKAVEARLRELGIRVLREPKAAGGAHWHLDW